jgi:protease-4
VLADRTLEPIDGGFAQGRNSMRKLLILTLAAGVALFAQGRSAQAGPEAKADKPPVKPVVAVFHLRGDVTEAPASESLPLLSDVSVSFKDLVTRMSKASKDPAVKAVVLLSEGVSLGSAQIEELRQVLARVRAAGKEIYAHGDSLTMGRYLLFSGANRISLVPTADVDITGLRGEAPYLRGLLNKLGVVPDFLTCGAYKSAAEVFMREGPSPEAEKMQNWLLDSTYDTYVNLIAQGRRVTPNTVRTWIDNGPYTAEKAKAAGLIDAVEHRQDFTALLKNKFGKDVVLNKKYGKKKGPKIDFSSPFAMFKIWAEILGGPSSKKSNKPAVAIVYVEGAISLGSGRASLLGTGGAYSSDLRKALDEAARDNAIKAVVLRVNSPGGSAVASEIILDATRRVKAKKPFVVSMGNVAGSGGYYVACAADTIFADAATITGSIGVVGGKLVTTGMWNKVGINFKSYQRGKNAAMLSSATPFSKSERERMQAYMDDIYNVFKGHVVAIRGKRLKKPIDELAGGRVYTGKQALELGLVDKIGSLQDAIEHIAAQAKLKDYEIRVVPRAKNLLEQLLEETEGKDNPHELDTAQRRPLLGGRTSLVDLALPYLKKLDPQRVRLVTTALQRLQLLHQEGAVLMMPEWRLVN